MNAMSTTYSYLQFVSYASIRNWSVHFLKGNDFGYSDRYPFVRIGSFLKRNKSEVVIEDDVEYKQVTVRTNNGGVCLRVTKKGKDIGTKKQMVVRKGQYIVSKIDARNGAFGIIPEELDGAIVTNDFPVFDVDNKVVNTNFLLLITTTKQFVAFAQSCSSGTTNRRRIDIDKFLEQNIPMPSLEEQEKLVDAYNAIMSKSDIKEQKAEQIDDNIQSFIFSQLGLIKSEKIRRDSLMSFIHFKDTLNRWDTYAIKEQYKSKWPVQEMGGLINSISTGTTPPTSHKEYFGGEIPFFTPADVSGEMYLKESERHLSQKSIDDGKARTYRKGTILFVGIGSTVGKVGIVEIPLCSSNQQITGFTVNQERVIPEYVYCFLHYNKDVSTAEQAKTTLPIVNQTKIAKIPIPVPPKEIQEEIVAYTKEKREQMSNLRAEAQRLMQQALEEFEKELFK